MDSHSQTSPWVCLMIMNLPSRKEQPISESVKQYLDLEIIPLISPKINQYPQQNLGINIILQFNPLNHQVVLIYGPTGVKKTQLAIQLAQKFSGEIINADSMQIYRGMNIGTNKICKNQQKNPKHHLIDIVNIDEYFSVAQFKKRAESKIDLILNQGHLPIVVGGTPLYFKVLLEGLLDNLPKDQNYRCQLEKLWNIKGPEFVYQKLYQIDPDSAFRIHKNDKKRVIRALEVHYVSHKKLSLHLKNQKKNPQKYNFLKIGLTMKRELLYQTINSRCEKMIQAGLIEEVKDLKVQGGHQSMQSMQGIGYRQILKYLNGEYNYSEALSIFKRDSRRLAKRQISYFSSFEKTNWYHSNDTKQTPEDIEKLISKVYK